MGDIFDQIATSPSATSGDIFDQITPAPEINPPPAAGPHIDMHRVGAAGVLDWLRNDRPAPEHYGMPGSFEGHPENIGEYVPASAGQLVSGAGDIAQGDIAKGGHKVISGLSNALLPAAPFAATAAPAVMLRALIGGALGGAVAQKGTQIVGGSPDQQQFAGDIGNLIGGYGGVKSSAIANRALPLAGVAAQDVISRVPYVGRAVRRPSIIDYIEALSKQPESNVPRGTPEMLQAKSLQQGSQPYNDPAAGLGKIPVKPASADPWTNLKFDKAAQEQARTELGAHADTTRVLERAQEIKTQMMQQGSQYQVVKVGALPKAKGNPFSGPNTPSVMEPAQSTNISLHGYHPESQTLVVQFKNGNVYSYKGVPQEIFDNYRNSESQGSFFANNIKGRYQTELRGTVKPTPGVRIKQALGGQP